MTIEIIGSGDQDRFYCAGSFTKVLTTFVCLSLLAEKYDLPSILDDEHFLDKIAVNPRAREFLSILQKSIGSQFTLRDVCTFYDGLPYTFDITADEVEKADRGELFKHHSIMDEQVFLKMCREGITQVDPNRCKFHYSELSIILLGYLIEKIFNVKMEDLYQKYIIEPPSLKNSMFSRTRPDYAYTQDLSVHVDYPCVAVMDHGYFCYGNSFYTTLPDQKKLIEHMMTTTVFQHMIDITHARSALNQIMNGLTIELRVKDDDVVFGYDGMSFSGCNAWAYSMKQQKGYLTIADDHDTAYNMIHHQIGYEHYDDVPMHTEKIYHDFLEHRHYEFEKIAIPKEYIGNYQRVMINDSKLNDVFSVGAHHIDIRNPERIKYDVLFDHGVYRIACKDHMHGSKVGFYQAKSGNRFMLFDGMLYKKM